MIPADFLDLGSRQPVRTWPSIGWFARARFAGLRRAFATSLRCTRYWDPCCLPPDAIAKAVAGREHSRLQPAGAYAANLLGLSDQVPAKVVFLTDGLSRTVQIGSMAIQLRRDLPRREHDDGRPAPPAWSSKPCGIWAKPM